MRITHQSNLAEQWYAWLVTRRSIIKFITQSCDTATNIRGSRNWITLKKHIFITKNAQKIEKSKHAKTMIRSISHAKINHAIQQWRFNHVIQLVKYLANKRPAKYLKMPYCTLPAPKQHCAILITRIKTSGKANKGNSVNYIKKLRSLSKHHDWK